MAASVAFSAQSNEAFLRIVSQQAPRADVVHFKMLAAAAILAAPTVALKHLTVEQVVGLPGEAEARPFLTQSSHADLRSRAKKVCFDSSGSSLYRRPMARSIVLGD